MKSGGNVYLNYFPQTLYLFTKNEIREGKERSWLSGPSCLRHWGRSKPSQSRGRDLAIASPRGLELVHRLHQSSISSGKNLVRVFRYSVGRFPVSHYRIAPQKTLSPADNLPVKILPPGEAYRRGDFLWGDDILIRGRHIKSKIFSLRADFSRGRSFNVTPAVTSAWPGWARRPRSLAGPICSSGAPAGLVPARPSVRLSLRLDKVVRRS